MYIHYFKTKVKGSRKKSSFLEATKRGGVKILLNYVVGWQSLVLLVILLQYLTKNMALLVQKFWREIFS